MFRKIFHFFKLVKALIGISRDPNRVENFFKVSDSLLALGAFQQMQKIIQSQPAALELIRQRKLLKPISLTELGTYPEGSLAKVFSDHMLKSNLDPDFYPAMKVETDEHYIIMRMRQTHDLLHLIIDFDTSEAGELGLQGFLMAQMASPLSMMLIGGTLLASPFKKQDRFFPYISSAIKGWQMGRQAKFFFAYDFDSNWTKTIPQIRQELDIEVEAPKSLKPAVVWFTGLSGSGKTTIATELSKKLKLRNLAFESLDGDSIRQVFSNTGYTRSERSEHIKRVGHLASHLEKHGILVLSSLISPYEESRQFNREICQRFVEVYVSTPLEVCESRDPKGLYKKARLGEIKNFTGLDDPYEAPQNPEIIIDTTQLTPEQAAEKIIRTLEGLA